VPGSSLPRDKNIPHKAEDDDEKKDDEVALVADLLRVFGPEKSDEEAKGEDEDFLQKTGGNIAPALGLLILKIALGARGAGFLVGLEFLIAHVWLPIVPARIADCLGSWMGASICGRAIRSWSVFGVKGIRQSDREENADDQRDDQKLHLIICIGLLRHSS